MATFKVFISYLVFLYMPIKLSTPLSTVKFKECFFLQFSPKIFRFSGDWSKLVYHQRCDAVDKLLVKKAKIATNHATALFIPKSSAPRAFSTTRLV